MQKKRTFMTAPDMMMVEDEDEEKKPPIVPVEMEPKRDIYDEYNEMLKDIVAA